MEVENLPIFDKPQLKEGCEKLLQISGINLPFWLLTLKTEKTDQPFKNMVNFELKDCVAPSASNS